MSDLREALEGAMSESEDREEQTTEVTQPVEESAPQLDPVEPTGDTPPSDEDRPVRDYVRDETGKFAPKSPQAPTDQDAGVRAGPKVGQPPSTEPKQARDPMERAPESWKPETRELWGQIPDAAKQEIVRWEATVKNGLKQAAEVRRFGDSIAEVVAPYRATIEAEGSNVAQAVGHLMQTAQALRTAPPGHKAELVAGMIKQFDIDVKMLDRALVGAMPEAVNPEVANVRKQFEQELAPLRQMQQQMQQQQQAEDQMRSQAAAEAVAQFEATQPEFLNDVAGDMAQVLELGQSRGVQYTLEQAYEIACRANPEIRSVLEQRERSAQLSNRNQNAQKARQAAVSLGGAPALGGEEKGADSVRDAILLAMDKSAR